MTKQNTTDLDARLAFEPLVRPLPRVRVLLDLSPDAIDARAARHGVEFWQLRTPLTAYRRHGGVPYALDNGCFGGSLPPAWGRMIEEAKRDKPLWATSPDVVGSARRTLELWPRFARQMNGIPRALVLQDGIGDHDIPWGELAAVFVGGSDAFKSSAEARHAAVAARMLGKLVHVGRVNTWARAREWADLADVSHGRHRPGRVNNRPGHPRGGLRGPVLPGLVGGEKSADAEPGHYSGGDLLLGDLHARQISLVTVSAPGRAGPWRSVPGAMRSAAFRAVCAAANAKPLRSRKSRPADEYASLTLASAPTARIGFGC